MHLPGEASPIEESGQRADNEKRIHERETVEVLRSRTSAGRGEADRLPRNIERYINPPRNSYYPWEYAYSLLGDLRERVVLDLGCGAGENTYTLAHRGAKVIGIDISPDLIALVRQALRSRALGGTVTLLITSAHALPMADESVDVVLGMAILHHLDIRLVCREVHRVLRPGGTAVFVEPVRLSRVLRWLRTRIPYQSPEVSPLEKPLTSADLDQFASAFRHFSARPFSLPHVRLAEVLRVPESVLTIALRLDRQALAWFPFLRGYAGVQVFRVVK